MTASKDQPTLSAAAATGDGRTVPRSSSLTHDVAGSDGDVAAIAIKGRSHAAIADTTTRRRCHRAPALALAASGSAQRRQRRDGVQAVQSAHAPAREWS